MNNAITFVENYISISKEDVKIIKSCGKFLSFHVNETWKKTDTDTTFDLTMVSYDGSELCEPVRTYIQSLFTNILSKDNMGLCRGDGLSILCKMKKQQAGRVQKKTISAFKNMMVMMMMTNCLCGMVD